MFQKTKLLFLCTGNSCRSQMAEGFAKALRPHDLSAHSAGLETHGLNPYAVRVMAEAGVDISSQHSKLLAEVLDIPFDLVVTVCDHAHETCPVFPSHTRVLHHSFPDPPQLAQGAKTEEEILDAFRQVRDQIRAFVLELKP
ncbi:MAG TPA: arsenate reductase ArsC [Planctomycetes bacterium]|nr:arsenate reductase ArsC [Planctomycetota bacterium]